MSKQYLVSRPILEHLLADNFKYENLCRYGEEDYAFGERLELMRSMVELPWNEGRSMEDMAAIIDEEDYDVEQLVSDQIDAFWEEYKEDAKYDANELES